MSMLPITSLTPLKRLVHILIHLARIDTSDERLLLLERANLATLRETISLTGAPEIFAHNLLRECNRTGRKTESGDHAFHLLLTYLQEIVEGQPDEVAFIAALLVLAPYGVQNFTGYAAEFQRLTEIYCKKMVEWHGKTRILGRANPISLNNIFTNVFIWDKPEALRHFTDKEMEVAYIAGDKSQGLVRFDALKIFTQNKRLFVLGKPGAGKSTFMKWVTLLAAQGEIQGIPIFITLKDIADAKRSVLEHILYLLTLCNIPAPKMFAQALLESGRAIVMFDGLDEVPSENKQQERIVRDIRDFVLHYGQNRFLITCRTAALTYTFQDFSYVEVADFTSEQVTTYITQYFAPNQERSETCLTELRQDRHKALRDLATSPLLLSLFCLIYEQNGAFPTARVDLYEEALSALLIRWNGTRYLKSQNDSPYGQMSHKRRASLYAILGYQNFRVGISFMKKKTLSVQVEAFLETIPSIPEHELDGEKALREMESQHGIIVERARQIHAFAHLTFQEYYTAKYIVDHDANNTINELITHINDRRWREVFLLTASLLENADTFFNKFLIDVNTRPLNLPILTDILKAAVTRTPQYTLLTPIDARMWNVHFSLSLARSSLRSHTRPLDRALVRDHASAFDIDNNRDVILDREIALARALDLNLDRDLVMSLKSTSDGDVDFVFDRALIRDLTLARAHDRALDQSLYNGVDVPRARMFARNRARNSAYDLVHALPFLDAMIRLDILFLCLGRTLWLAENLVPYITATITTAIELRLSSLATSLSKIDIPIYDDIDESSNIWTVFRHTIATMASIHWGLLLNMKIIKVDAEYIDEYLYANRLLIECLNLAVVTDRTGIKRSLLMPPNL